MKKRILSLVLVLCMVLSLLPTSALAAMTAQQTAAQTSANPFQDVKETDWYYDAVQYARVNGFFSGTSAAAFDPSGTMTRGMFVTVLGRMTGVDAAAYAGQSAFTDVPADQYYAPYVAWAAKHGITGGTGEGKFSPDALIDRQQMATFFVRYFESFNVAYDTGDSITTVPADMDSVAGYAKEAVVKLWEKGLLNGDGRSFDPTSSATRAQTAALCMRLDKAVKVWYSEPGVPSTRVSIDPTAPKDDSGWGNDDWDSDSDSEADTYAVRFYDGSRLIDTLYAEANQPLSRTPSVEKYSKANAILVGWYTDPGFTTPFYAEEPVTANTAAYAKYEDMGDTETLNLTSYAQMDQSSDLRFTIKRTSGSVDAAEAAELTVKDGSDPVAISVTAAGDGTYTVAADEGFNEGCSYELTLADGWVFVDSETGAEKPDTIRTASFSIAMEEVENLKMSDGIRYIQDTAAIDYTVDGTSYAELTSDLADQGGTFRYDGEMPAVGDLLCIYVGVHPARRDAHNGSELLDPAVYVKVSDVSGDTVTFTKLTEEDQQEIYNIPDNFPIQVAQLPAEATGTVNISALDAEMYATMMGAEYDLDKAKESIAAGDFVTLYVSRDAITGEDDLYYGEITAYDASTGEITYTQTTRQTILESMDLYANVGLEGSDLITDEEKAELEAVLLEQVRSSGFAEDAAYMLADIVTKTDGFRSNMTIQELLLTDENGDPLSEDAIQLMNIGGTFELSDDIELTVELINEGDQLHFEHGSVQMAVGVDATFEVDVDDDKIAIDLSATFVQEVGLDPRIKGKMVYKEILWIPVPIGVNVSASIDIRSFSAISLDAKVYTVAEEEKGTWDTLKDIAKKPADALGLDSLPDGLVKGLESVGDVMDKIDELKEKAEKAKEAGEKFQGYLEDADTLWAVVEENGIVTEEAWEAMGEALGKTSITSDLLDLMNLSAETELSTEYYESMQELMNRYCKMIEQESDWIKLVDAQIMMVEINILGVVMGVEARFIVRTDMSLAIGSNLQYEVGKRFNFWFEVGLFEPTGGSDSMDLIDEQFAFQFYAMGRIALKAGVRARCYTGIGSKAFASAGYAVELGPYVKAYGFFVYEYTKHRAANTDDWIASDRMAGAVFMEFGLYFRIGYEANLIGSLIDIKVDFCDVMIPLFNVGESQYCYMFDYQPAEDEAVIVRDADGNSTNGITMTLPASTLALSYIDLNTGMQGSESLDYDQYLYILSNPNFHLDDKTGTITVTVPENTRYMECDLTVTYRHGKLAFSQYDMAVTVPLVWTNLSTEELSEYYTASVRVGNSKDGYQTVWSKRVLKNQPFDLPTDDEIQEMIGWSDYKYTGSSGYGSQTTTDLTLIEDTAYDYKVNYRTYKLPVEDIQDADGSTYSKTYTAKFGEAFDFSDLSDTGTADDDKLIYTKFSQLTTDAVITVGGEEVPLDLTRKINAKMADALSSGVTAAATYVDNSAAVTFEFTGLTHEPVTMTVCRGTVPSLEEVEEIISYNGLALKDIFPAVGKVNASTVYQVVCGQLTGPDATITFHENGGSEVAGITKVVGSLVGTLPTPTREGYTFDGWYTDDGTFDDEFTARKMPEGGAELYAKWTAEEYTLTFHVNGGNALAEDQETKTITYDSTYGRLPEPTRSGYGFIGWFTEAEGGEAVTAADIVTTAGDHTLYAHWKVLKEIPAAVFDFGEAEGGTYEKGLTHEVLYAFVPEDGEIYAEDDFTLKYMCQGGSEYESGLPVNAGTYNVTISRPADNDYAKFEQTYTAVITIDKAVRYLGAVDICTFDPGMTWMDLQLDGDGGIDDLSNEATFTYQVVKKSGNGPDGHTSASADRDSLVTGLFPETEYYVTVKVTDDPNYEDAQSTLEGASVVSTLSAPTGNWSDHADTDWYDSSLSEFTLYYASELAGLAKLVNDGTTFSGKTVKLGADIDLLAYQWTPIGKVKPIAGVPISVPFAGTFDGRDHTVSGMYVNSDYAGLFRCLGNATIGNVTLEDSYVTGSDYAGGIVGYAATHNNRSVISNCVVEKTVTVYGTSSGDSYTGGIAGECYNEYSVTGCTNRGTVYGRSDVGGIVGYSNDAIIITNCVNYGPIHGTGSYIGGITGYTYDECNVLNSANFGSVTGKDCVGGIVGKTQRKSDGKKYPNNVLNCYNVGTVYGETYVGAIVGGRHTTNDAVHQCYYLQGCAKNSNGTVCKAVGINGTGSTDEQDNLQIACFTSYNSQMTGTSAGDCGLTNLITALNNWVVYWNDGQCNAEWEEGPDGYPLPTGEINTKAGTKR